MNPFALLVLCVAGWLNRNQQNMIEYLQEEIRVLKELMGKKPRFNVSVKSGAWDLVVIDSSQRNYCAHTGLGRLGFQRLGTKSLTWWLVMEGSRRNTSVRYSWGLIPRRRQLWMIV